jgi:hypothetical protein
VKNAVSERPESNLNYFKQFTQKDEQRSKYREEGGEYRTEGRGDSWTQVPTELNGRQGEGPAFGTSFFLNKLYRGNTMKSVMSRIFNRLC